VLQVIRAHDAAINGMTIVRAASGDVAVTAGADGHVRAWNLSTRALLWGVADAHPYRAPGSTRREGAGTKGLNFKDACTGAMAVTAVGTTAVATVGQEGDLRLWAVADGRALAAAVAAHAAVASACAGFTDDDGVVVASGGRDGAVRLWRCAVVDGEHALSPLSVVEFDATAAGAAPEVNGIAFSPRGDLLACTMSTGVVAVLHATARFAHLRVVASERLPASALGVAFSPCGAQLAVGTDACTVFVLDVAASAADDGVSVALARTVEPLRGHSYPSNSVCFVDGDAAAPSQVLASASSDGMVKLWRLGREVAGMDDADLALDAIARSLRHDTCMSHLLATSTAAADATPVRLLSASSRSSDRDESVKLWECKLEGTVVTSSHTASDFFLRRVAALSGDSTVYSVAWDPQLSRQRFASATWGTTNAMTVWNSASHDIVAVLKGGSMS
jgi:WD40 repeat protein